MPKSIFYGCPRGLCVDIIRWGEMLRNSGLKQPPSDHSTEKEKRAWEKGKYQRANQLTERQKMIILEVIDRSLSETSSQYRCPIREQLPKREDKDLVFWKMILESAELIMSQAEMISDILRKGQPAS